MSYNRYQSPKGAGMTAAPVAVSDDLQQYTRFMGTGTNGNMRMKACAPICQLLSTATTGNDRAILISANGAQAVQLNLTEPTRVSGSTRAVSDYVSPVFDLISTSFVRYKLRNLRFHYMPQSKATADGRLVFAFAKDPEHPLVLNETIDSENLLAVSDSIAFAPWRSWSMDVSHHLDDTLYYTYSDPSTGGTSQIFAERFSDFGIIGCVTDTQNAQFQIGGVLYMEIDVELVEFCPIALVSPSSAKRTIAKLQKRIETFEKRKAQVQLSCNAASSKDATSTISTSTDDSLSLESTSDLNGNSDKAKAPVVESDLSKEILPCCLTDVYSSVGKIWYRSDTDDETLVQTECSLCQNLGKVRTISRVIRVFKHIQDKKNRGKDISSQLELLRFCPCCRALGNKSALDLIIYDPDDPENSWI